MIENNWASMVLCGLCLDSAQLGTSDPAVDSGSVRRVVLEAIGKSLKDSIATNYKSTELRYSRYLALVELVQQLLSYKPPPSASNSIAFSKLSKTWEEHFLQVAKVMLEKGYVVLLSNIISDLDVNHPKSKILLGKFLKPLESLTKFSIKISRTPDAPTESPQKGESREVVMESHLPLESEENGDLSNIYRNSALSMFGPRSDVEDVEDTSGDDEEGFDEFSDDEMIDGDEVDDMVHTLFSHSRAQKSMMKWKLLFQSLSTADMKKWKNLLAMISIRMILKSLLMMYLFFFDHLDPW
jgi:E3 ubiquitin-protein ligase HUWE1